MNTKRENNLNYSIPEEDLLKFTSLKKKYPSGVSFAHAMADSIARSEGRAEATKEEKDHAAYLYFFAESDED